MEGCNKMVELPPGYRFHPTDEELVTQYLSPKVLDCSFTTEAVGEVDLNKVEPWDLPWRANIGEKEWYFFCVRDRKYPNGSRTNRATNAGYWKATGKDKEIFRAKILVGMKKTLVFYRGRSPKGEKTNWVMHEYRLQGKNSNFLSNTDKQEWVICRVFKKNSGGNKVHISGLVRNHDPRFDLPPLIDLSSDVTNTAQEPHVTCFSNIKQDLQYESAGRHTSVSNMKFSYPNSISSSQTNPFEESLHCPDFVLKQEQATLCHLFKTNSPYMKPNAAAEFSQDFGENAKLFPYIYGYEDGLKPYGDLSTIISTEQIHIDCLWNY